MGLQYEGEERKKLFYLFLFDYSSKIFSLMIRPITMLDSNSSHDPVRYNWQSVNAQEGISL